ncbi:hypothetical protein RN001_009975 [Aquatica leii]|uniref:Uncharacterized protein n=1 Tax=Aquatica leii TaxID=1421715 RepID=A0AAN7SFV7_9COLE|nr:hypothetical protein RN001_009975 [Aquatica leii]
MSGPRMNPPINGNSRRPTNYVRMSPMDRPSSSQHDDLIKFIYDSWTKVSQEVTRNTGNTASYYQAYWGRRNVQHH